MRQVAHIIETPSGTVRLPCRRNKTTDQAEENQRGGNSSHFISAHELSGPITNRVFARPNWSRCHMASNVFRKLLDRLVTAFRFFAQRHQHDVVEITAE